MGIRLLPWSLAGLTALVLLLVGQNAFVLWGDDAKFANNPSYRGLAWTHLVWMFTSAPLGHYTPVAWLATGLVYGISGMKPGGYHVTSLLLHVLCVVVVYHIAVRLLRLAVGVGPQEPRTPVRIGATIATLLFAVHPLRVEPVAWASALGEGLSALLYLLVVLLYLRARDPRRPAPRSALGRHAPIGLFALALLSSPLALSLAVVLVILDLYPPGRLPDPDGRQPTARPVWTEKALYAILAATAVVLTVLTLAMTARRADVPALAWADRLATSVYALAFGLWKTVLPLQLLPVYELHAGTRLLSWPNLASAATVAVITVLALRLRRRWPAVLAVWAAHVAIMLPHTLLAPDGSVRAADRYTYLACIGWTLLAGGILLRLWRVSSRRAPPLARPIVTAAAVICLGALAALSWRQVNVWHDSERLWSHVLAADPRSSLAHYGLGRVRIGQGRLVEAVGYFEDAARLRPDLPAAHSYRGLLLIGQGRYREAETSLQRARDLRPDLASSHNDLGLAQMGLGNWAAAAASLEQALRISPDLAIPRANLGLVLLKQDKPAEALKHLERALEVAPTMPGLEEARDHAAGAAGRKPTRAN